MKSQAPYSAKNAKFQTQLDPAPVVGPFCGAFELVELATLSLSSVRDQVLQSQ